MRLRQFERAPLPKYGRTTQAQLAPQVLPFVGELTGIDGDQRRRAHRADFARVERVTSRLRFRQHAGEIGVDRRPRRRMRLKAKQLRMVPVADRFPAQYRSRQQRLAPQCNEALGIEIAGVKCPESHALSVIAAVGFR